MTAVGGQSVRFAASAGPASTVDRSRAAASRAWAYRFAALTFQRATAALRRVTTDYRAGVTAMSTQDLTQTQPNWPGPHASPQKPRTTCLDLYGEEFHFVLTDRSAPHDQRRWSIDLVDGRLFVRTWNDGMSNAHTIAIERTGSVPRVVEPHT